MYIWRREVYIWDVKWVSYLGGISSRGDLYAGDILTGFYSIGYGIEFNHFIKIFGNFKGKKTWKDPPEERDGNTGT